MRWLLGLVLGGLVMGWGGAALAQDETADLEELRDVITIPPEDVVRAGRGSLPFTEAQIEFLAGWMRDAQEATERAGNPPAEGRIRRLDVDSGQAAIPLIAVRWGYATALSFVDLTGAPWPIAEVVVDSAFLPEGDGGGDGVEGSGGVAHVLYLVPRRRFLHGNAVVQLQGHVQPVVLRLLDDGELADFRVEVRLAHAGPNADASALVVRRGFHAGDAVLLDLLGGVIPRDAERLVVDGGSYKTRAWRHEGDVLMVSPSLVLSPGAWAAEKGSGERWAYRLPDSPVVLVARDGRQVRLSLRAEESAVLLEDVLDEETSVGR